jgi:hypothetical protein
MLTLVPPYRMFLQAYGSGFGDVAFAAGGNTFVTERFRKAWEAEGLTGIESFSPVEILGVKRRRRFVGEPPPYYFVRIVRSQAAMDEGASRVIRDERPVCPVCREGGNVEGFYGIFFEEGTVEGYDLFYARGAPELIAGERYKEFRDRHRISDSHLTFCEEYIPAYFRPDYYDPEYANRFADLDSNPALRAWLRRKQGGSLS